MIPVAVCAPVIVFPVFIVLELSEDLWEASALLYHYFST